MSCGGSGALQGPSFLVGVWLWPSHFGRREMVAKLHLAVVRFHVEEHITPG